MLRIYKAIISGDHIEWIDKPPKRTRPMQVNITLLEEMESVVERGQVMAQALTALSEKETFSAISDSVAWQRKERRDRSLPDRDL